ncbi:MAG: WYL domain-containing protein [Succinivibrio sp.]|nr:WYL domain-containing protein [Succinivibrio sp.]
MPHEPDSPVQPLKGANKWNQQRRLEFIDYRLYSAGRINRTDLVDFFQISVAQASLDLARYQLLVQSDSPPRYNLEYDRHVKYYQRTSDFQPLYPKLCSPQRYLADLLDNTRGELHFSINFLGYAPPVVLIPGPPRQALLKRQVLCNLVEAIRTRRAVHVSYRTAAQADNLDHLIAPHSLCFDGQRWRVRAYCYDHHKFTDYDCLRIVGCDVPVTPAPDDRFPDPLSNNFKEVGVAAADDDDWNEVVDIVLRANPELSESERRLVEYDYGMSRDGTVVYACRVALLYYALYNLRLTEQFRGLPAQERRLYLDNEGELSVLMTLPDQ